MASKRQRGEKWEFVFKKAGVLDKPLYLTFDSEEEGDAYAQRLDSLLAKGIVPTEFQLKPKVLSIANLVQEYERDAHPSMKDRSTLGVVVKQLGDEPLLAINAAWVDAWIEHMKRVEKLAPASIRARIGTMARATDWAVRKGLMVLPDMPFRTLPDGYSQYTKLDESIAGVLRVDIERDRRLVGDEYERILKVIESGVLPRKQRPLKLDVAACKTLFVLATESAMRMREMFTLTTDQVDLRQRTIFLEKTKNGDKRQVPLSSVALAALTDYLKDKREYVFPWWLGNYDEKELHKITDQVSKLFGSIFEIAGCDDLTFHDLRHEAVSRFFERTTLTETAIMKISGHKSQRMLMRYANLRASDLAKALW